MSMSRSAPTSKPKVSKTRQVIPLQVNKPVLSRAQTFEEDEDEDEAGDDAAEVDDDGDDDITISDRSHTESSRSARSAPSAAKSRKRSGYGDETDEDFVDDTSEDEEPDSSDEAFVAPSDEEEQADGSELDDDDLEIVHNVVESDEADSDVELVPTRATTKKPAIKTAKVSSKASRKPTALSTQARAIHDGQTTQIFFELQEVVEEVSILTLVRCATVFDGSFMSPSYVQAFKTQDADYDQSFDDILTCIAEARCQVSAPDSCLAQKYH